MNEVAAYEAASHPTRRGPVPTTPGILQESAHEWARRNLVARAMALEPIGDIADKALTDNSTTTLTWETATDWDNAAVEKSVVHEGYGDLTGTGTVQLGYTGAVGASHHHLHDTNGPAEDVSGNNRSATINGAATTDVTGIVNTTGFSFDGVDNWLDTNAAYAEGSALTVFAWVKPASTHSGKLIGKDSDSVGRSWNLALLSDGSVRNEIHGAHGLLDSGSYSTGTWQFIGMTWDGSNAYTYIDGTQVGSDTGASGSINSGPEVSIGRRNYSGAEDYYDGDMAHPHVIPAYRTEAEMQALYEAAVTGYLETATKSFNSAKAPDLQNLSYSLNTQSITLDVIGSPGTASEEVVSQALDGSNSYNLTWSNTHTDFRIKPVIDTTDPTTSPTFSRGELGTP